MTHTFLDFKEIVEKRVRELRRKENSSASSTATSNLSVADELEKLLKLREKGILDDKEFEFMKKKLMDS